MKRILAQFAHPALHKSRINRAILARISGLSFVTVNDLYLHYPDFQIDVLREKDLLARHDIIAFIHPFYWYSSPSIIKEWQDVVLEYGYAYGHGGEALAGKSWLTAITTGGGRDAYKDGGSNRYEVQEFLRPFEQTARLCHMEFLSPYITYATHALASAEIAQAADGLSVYLTSIAGGVRANAD